MKKLLAIALAAVLLASLFAACGGVEGATATAPDTHQIDCGDLTMTPPPPREFLSVIVPKWIDDYWSARQKQGGQQWAEDTGNKSMMVGSDKWEDIGNVAAQIQWIQDALILYPDFLTVIPLDPDACEEVLAQAIKNGIIVTTQGAPDMQNIHYNIEPFDDVEFGAHFFEKAMDEIQKDKGKYACIVQSSSSTRKWSQGLIDYQKTNHPEWELVTGGPIEIEITDDWLANAFNEIYYTKTKELLQEYPNIDLLWGAYDSVTVAMGRAVNELGLNDKVYVCGVSMSPSSTWGLFDGSINFVSFWDPFELQYVCNIVSNIVLDGMEVKLGDNLRRVGYNCVKSDGKVIKGNAWIDVTKDNFEQYNFM